MTSIRARRAADAATTAPVPRGSSRLQQAEDAFVSALDRFGLKTPLRRLYDAGPAWMTRLNTRDVRRRERLVDEAHLEEKYRAAIALLKSRGFEVGAYLEFGVFNGTSLVCMHRALVQAGDRTTRLVGFDSFEGLPAVAASDSGGHWQPGQFKCSLDFTRRVLDHEGVERRRVTLVKGYFDATLTPQRRRLLNIDRVGIVMIDCDLYQSTKEALGFCGPIVIDTAVIFFDDWYPLATQGLGERMAFEEWLAANPGLHAEELFEFEPRGKAFLVTRS
jgi:hypothetical protein